MKKNKPLTDLELKAIVDAEIDKAMGEMSGELAESRTTAMDRYLGEARGDELEGRSSVQGRDIMDVVEWIMPSLVKMFMNADASVIIEPVGEEDETQAEQETDVINHIFWKKNEGFLIMYSWFKDALLQKNGITKNWPEEVHTTVREEYENLYDIEYQALLAEDELELVEHSEELVTMDVGGQVLMHEAVFNRTKDKTEIKIDVIAPEEFLISTDATSVNPKMARFSGHYTEKTISELREMEFSDADINKMENGITHSDLSEESFARKNLSDETRYDDGADSNEAMQPKKITEGYIRVDQNGDGIAELLQIFRSGDFIKYEEVERNPFNAITPIILTHKFFGLSVADILMDIQDIRTSILRSYLDNFNQSINGTTYYNENTVNIEDMLTSTPFGIRAVDGQPGADIFHVPASGLPPQAFSLDEMLDKLRADRIGDIQSQLDPNVMANANNGVVVEMLNEAKGKVEMIGRIFAETGVKNLFRDIHALARTHGDKEMVLKLRGEWTPVDPTSWQDRTDFTVKVGLGNRDRQQEAVTIKAIMDDQMMLLDRGLLAPIQQNQQTGEAYFPIYETRKRFAEIMGESNPDKYYPHPSTMPPPPPEQADPNMEVLKLTAEVERQKDNTKQTEIALKNQIEGNKLMLKGEEVKAKASEAAAKQDNADLKLQLDAFKQQKDTEINELKSLLEAQKQAGAENEKNIQLAIDTRNKQLDRELEEYKASLSASTSIVTSDALPEEVKASASEQMLASLVGEITGLREQLTAPKEVIRDESGQVVQVGNQKVIRENDLITRLE